MSASTWSIRCVATGHICYLLEDEEDAKARVKALCESPESTWEHGDLFIREVFVEPKRQREDLSVRYGCDPYAMTEGEFDCEESA